MTAFGHHLRAAWQARGALAISLWPVSLLYRLMVAVRRCLYRRGWLKSAHPGRPVIVVGNVIAGGAGKTPVVIAIAQHLRAAGLRPGVISRGYGRKTGDTRQATEHSTAHEVGDEPALIARSLKSSGDEPSIPIYVAQKRLDAAHALLKDHPETDVIICDDGLQHLALSRDVEICIFNDSGIGNGLMLPAGPLREPWPRQVDYVLYAGRLPAGGPGDAYPMSRRLAPYALTARGIQIPLETLLGRPLHAVAAIARPESFFEMLRGLGLTLALEEALPDHYDFDSWQRSTRKEKTLICTEKDAVKLWGAHPDALAVPLQLQIDPVFFIQLDAQLARVRQRASPQLSSISSA